MASCNFRKGACVQWPLKLNRARADLYVLIKSSPLIPRFQFWPDSPGLGKVQHLGQLHSSIVAEREDVRNTLTETIIS